MGPVPSEFVIKMGAAYSCEGDQWQCGLWICHDGRALQMLKYNTERFCWSLPIHLLFREMEKVKLLWIDHHSILVDCLNVALANEDMVVGAFPFSPFYYTTLLPVHYSTVYLIGRFRI